MVTYDKHYTKIRYFGKPYEALVAFFEKYPSRGKLVDLGAGQGRDALFLAALGYEVDAVDVSGVGLKQIEAQNPHIKTVQADIYDFCVNGYDFVLMDSMLHFYRRDMTRETKLVEKLLEDMSSGAVLVNCLNKSDKAEKTLMSIVEAARWDFEIIENSYIDYPEGKCEYHLLAIKKQ